MNRHKIFTRSELNAMAKEKGIRYYDYPGKYFEKLKLRDEQT